jgi:hypothetical protein
MGEEGQHAVVVVVRKLEADANKQMQNTSHHQDILATRLRHPRIQDWQCLCQPREKIQLTPHCHCHELLKKPSIQIPNYEGILQLSVE